MDWKLQTAYSTMDELVLVKLLVQGLQSENLLKNEYLPCLRFCVILTNTLPLMSFAVYGSTCCIFGIHRWRQFSHSGDCVMVVSIFLNVWSFPRNFQNFVIAVRDRSWKQFEALFRVKKKMGLLSKAKAYPCQCSLYGNFTVCMGTDTSNIFLVRKSI